MPQYYPHDEAARQYANDIVDGVIPACRLTKLACQRHLKDVKRKRFKYKYDPEIGERVCKFIALMPHTKGEWARRGETIKLEPWQCFIVCSIFGWVNKKTGLRRFREAYIEVPRKNAKSTLVAAIGLYTLCADGEHGAEVFAGATTEKQAWAVFGVARQMAKKAKGFKEKAGIEVNAANINQLSTGSKFEPIIGKPGDGDSPSMAIIDEYHEHKSSELYDTMNTGMGARSQPLTFIITTAGDNLSGPCFDKRLEARDILQGVYKDETRFMLVYTVDQDDDWTTELALMKANPNYGVSVSKEYLLQQQQTAVNRTNRQGIFKTKHLNIWVAAKNAYFNIEKWNQLADEKLKIEDFATEEMVGSFDLASKIDMTAFAQVFEREGHYYVFFTFYLPEDVVMEGINTHYTQWHTEGRIVATPGNITDYEFIEEDLKELAKKHQITALPYDPHQATQFSTRMMAEGLPMVEYGNTVLNMSEPMKWLEALILSGRIHHNGCPVMTWMMSNVVAKIDAKDNIFPRKEKPENKIDGPIALIMALGFMMKPGATNEVTQGFVEL